jgi:hypothetical protein
LALPGADHRVSLVCCIIGLSAVRKTTKFAVFFELTETGWRTIFPALLC